MPHAACRHGAAAHLSRCARRCCCILSRQRAGGCGAAADSRARHRPHEVGVGDACAGKDGAARLLRPCTQPRQRQLRRGHHARQLLWRKLRLRLSGSSVHRRAVQGDLWRCRSRSRTARQRHVLHRRVNVLQDLRNLGCFGGRAAGRLRHRTASRAGVRSGVQCQTWRWWCASASARVCIPLAHSSPHTHAHRCLQPGATGAAGSHTWLGAPTRRPLLCARPCTVPGPCMTRTTLL